MNERIRKLIEQSRDLIQKKVMLGGQVYVPGPLEPGDVNLEKFAELLLQECIEIVQPEPYDGDAMTASLNAKVKQIKQRFGVE